MPVSSIAPFFIDMKYHDITSVEGIDAVLAVIWCGYTVSADDKKNLFIEEFTSTVLDPLSKEQIKVLYAEISASKDFYYNKYFGD